MRGALSARSYVSARGIARLRGQLSERDLAVLRLVATLRLMSARQIQAVHFPNSQHERELAATRARQRVVTRLTRDRLLVALTRRIGGVRAGSAGLVLALGPLGPRVLRLSGRRRAYEPTERFVDHTLAVSQLIVDVIVGSRSGQLDPLDWQSEPDCWRNFDSLSGQQSVRPDAFLSLGVGAYELRWFIEVDRATESLPTILRKCRLYADYYQSGVEQAKGGVFPRVCWTTPDDSRAERLRDAIGRDRQLPAGLFVVTTSQRALRSLTALDHNHDQP
jgi:hypothetical protein